MRRAISTPILVLLAAATCMPQARINRSCEWRNDSVEIGPPGSAARRNHLKEDVRVAQDLGIRYGDSTKGRIWSEEHLRARASCTNASLEQIKRQHGASQSEIVAVTGARELWLDLLLVVVPMLILYLMASRLFVRHVVGGFDSDDRVIVLLILGALVPMMAFAGVGIARVWAVSVEQLRLRSDHISRSRVCRRCGTRLARPGRARKHQARQTLGNAGARFRALDALTRRPERRAVARPAQMSACGVIAKDEP
jgi:hypothetical protein